MCGIFGIKFTDNQKHVDLGMLTESTDLMFHRGPDDSGYWTDGSLGLGHRRLSIIDLSPLGHQPMFNEDGSVVLVYNGEIYNYLELYKDLQERGHVFRSKSDTEVIIHAYEEWGYDCLKKFNGMFAFGLWDIKKQSLWVARDRLGVKPLYYYWNGSVFIFSSEIKPILKTGYVTAKMNEAVLDSYFSVGYVPGPATMFKDIMKLMPGHYCCLEQGVLSDRLYWDFADISQTELSNSQCEEKLLSLLQDSIAIRLRSDVPLGIFLSGGLDSSAVVALTNEMTMNRINTFTVGYDKSTGVSEELFAEIVAKLYNTEHHVFRLEPDNFMSSIDNLVSFSEEPIVEPAAVALYNLSKLARQKATVLLSGEGSDELFAGYFLYEFMSRIDKIQGIVPTFIFDVISPFVQMFGKAKFNKYSDWFCQPLSERYQGTSSYLTRSHKEKMYSREFYEANGNYLEQTFTGYFNNVRHNSDNLQKMLYVDTKTWLVDDLLLKADKMTMAASIELRVPFLDYRLVEMAASLPKNQKLNAGNGKVILKSIMKERLPKEIISRKKLGFPVPVNNWFGNELFNDVKKAILDSFVPRFVSKAYIEHMLDSHVSNQEDNSKFIMSLLVIARWEKIFLEV